MQKASYRVQKSDFIIENYNWAKPFADFFPGIAGKYGVPMWLYFVSRGQGLISAGVNSKDQALMEFTSFNKALNSVGTAGFRTFIKSGAAVYEPFRKTMDAVRQEMIIRSGELEFREENPAGLTVRVVYFPLVQSRVPALLRMVHFKNEGDAPLDLEIVDGLPRMICHGMDRHCMQVIARHVEGMIETADADGLPLFRLKQPPADVEKIEKLRGGNFYFSMTDGNLLKENIIVDPAVIFGDSSDYEIPWGLRENGVDDLLKAEQIRFNKTPCAMTAVRRRLAAGEEFTLTSCMGYGAKDATPAELARLVADSEFIAAKRAENAQIIEDIKNNAQGLGGRPEFDEYVRSMFLDNVIRGGMPVPLETAAGPGAFYIYSRQNGDLERDYHEIILEPTYYSQGHGHYRSVNQNRRLDCRFFPEIGDYNIFLFINLLQTDGYNPLEVTTISYRITDEKKLKKNLKGSIPAASRSAVLKYLEGDFTPGGFLMLLEDRGVPREEWEEVLAAVLVCAAENESGAVHEGFWVDHWHYNLDLIDDYLSIYPERLKQLLIDRDDYTFFDDADVIRPRDEKYVLTEAGVRQYGAVERDEKKQAVIAGRKSEAMKTRVNHGKGKVYRVNLAVKLLCLAANRIAALDPDGVGVEMESDKPGWNDSMNGLPGILGSTLGEALELEKLCLFLRDALPAADVKKLNVFEELHDLVKGLTKLLKRRVKIGADGAFAYWSASHDLREKYLAKTRYGVGAKQKALKAGELRDFLDSCVAVLKDISSGDLKAKAFDEQGVPYTYFENRVVKWKTLKAGKKERRGSGGYPLVRALRFSPRPLKRFLEGPMHMLRVHPEMRREIHRAVKESPIYDGKLKMYKVCESLEDETFEIGRVKAWPSGWIENESVYTHMVYKYLLELLRSGLHAEFFEDIQTCFTCFLDPDVYGRSIFQNVSFIVSSAYGDESMHGRGFQARLSGVTSELIHMWSLMTAGARPFRLNKDGGLEMALEPALPEWMFTTEPGEIVSAANGEAESVPANAYAFRFMGRVLIVYHNEHRKNTYDDGMGVREYRLTRLDGTEEVHAGAVLPSAAALAVREGKVKRMDVMLG